jgi:hypothetical protein
VLRKARFQCTHTGYSRRMPPSNGNTARSEADRYEQAATESLELLDWCIGYFVGSKKGQIAAELASNRRYIKENLMQEREEPLPTSKK